MKPTKPPQISTASSAASGALSPKKRPSPSSTIPSPTTQRPTFTAPSSPRRRTSSGGGQISRSISACNRCRSRKTKCDQLFPSCSSCSKAGVECVGIDAATGRKVPRSYVDWLEKRVQFLEQEMGMVAGECGVGGVAGGEGSLGGGAGGKRKLCDSPTGGGDEARRRRRRSDSNADGVLGQSGSSRGSISDGLDSTSRDELKTEDKALHLRPDIENLVSQVGMVSVQGTSAPGFLGGSSGISFARLMFAAVKMNGPRDGAHSLPQPSNSATSSIKGATSSSPPKPTTESTDTVADSATQLPRQRVVPEPFPSRHIGENFMDLYFNLANPQTPILQRPTFERIFRRACTQIELEGGNGLPNPSTNGEGYGVGEKDHQHHADLYCLYMVFAIAVAVTPRTDNLPERFHASAMLHMDGLFSAISQTNNRLDGLKGILLLALYSIMRPAAPGVWYVLGAALRLAIDLGLHQENTFKTERNLDPQVIDERRRLWWCTYAMDRQLGLYLGRPFGISDDAIRTPLPVEDLDGWSYQAEGTPVRDARKSCRTIFNHMFRIRQIQSEIQRVLYQSSSALPRQFMSVDEWRKNVEERLQTWCDTVPKSNADTNCAYNLGFMELNYEQTRLLLYGLCPTVPHPTVASFGLIADSGSRIIRLYRRLHHEDCINYTWLACHNLFMAGTSYLCALWHCPEVRRQTTVEQIDFYTLACVDVLSSMITRCPAAQGCKDVFESLATATVKLCNSEFARDRENSKKQVKSETAGWALARSRSPVAFTPPALQSLPASLANIVHGDPYQPEPPAPQPNYADMMPPPLPPPPSQEIQFIPQDLAAECLNMDRVFEMMQQVGTPGGEWDLSSWGEGTAAGYSNGVMGMGAGMGGANAGGDFFVGWAGF